MKDPFVLATILTHPDDETFGVGGTLIRYADEGMQVHSLCLTQGEQGWNGDPEKPLVPPDEPPGGPQLVSGLLRTAAL